MALLIASVNVTSLLLSKASARRSEMALRLSLGAPRGRLIRLQFLESFLLTAAAGAIGVYIAQAASTPLYVFLAEESPRFSLAPDGLTMVYIFGLVFLAACVSGLAPALESLRIDLASALKGAGYGGLALARGARLRGLLISAQTGMSLALLVAAGLFARVFFQIAFADPGFDTNRVIAVSVRFPMTGDSRTDRAESAEVIRALVDRVRSVPGIRAATYANDMPVDGGGSRSAVKDGSFVPFRQFAVSPGYFETLGLPILRGRAFQFTDRRAGRESTDSVISQAMARALWPGVDPIGKRIITAGGPVLNVIGVAADARDPGRNSLPAAYIFEEPGMAGSYLLARCNGEPQAAARAIQSAIREFKPEFMVTPMPLQKWLDRLASIAARYGSVVWITGLMACALAIAGIYGVASFEVGVRTKEIGIRMAVGAQRRDIVRQMLLSVGRPVGAGVLAGLWLSLGASGLLSAVSGTESPMDPANALVHLGCAVLLAGAAAGAVLVSTLRRLRRDPVEALRLN
jgi:predicted permease